MGEPENLNYMRGQQFRNVDLTNHVNVPYDLSWSERGEDVDSLLSTVLDQLIPGVTKMQGPDLREFLATYEVDGRLIFDWGFWNLLARGMSHEAYELARVTSGYDTPMLNWNAFDTISLNFDLSPGVTFSALVGRYQAVRLTIAGLFEEAGGTVNLGHRLRRAAKGNRRRGARPGFEPVHAVRDDALDRAGHREVAKVRAGCHRAHAVDHVDQLRVAQSMGDLLDEQRIAALAIDDDVGDRVGERGDPEPAAGQLDGIVGGERGELDQHGGGIGQQLGVLRGQGADRPGGHHREHGRPAPEELAQQRPGGGVEPVRVVDADHERLGGGIGEERQQELPAGLDPALVLESLGARRVGEVEIEHDVE